MLGELTDEQIDHVLNSQVVARLGCYANGEMYVVPVTYAYDGTFIYAYSREGMKIRMMRENKHVCFEVDVMENMASWRSVIAWGTFEELVDEEAQQRALQILLTKVERFVISETARPHRQTMSPQVVENERKAIVYRIRVDRKTGRFEKTPG